MGRHTASNHALAASETGDATLAWPAMTAHPLVDSVAVARRLLDDFRAEVPGLAYLR